MGTKQAYLCISRTATVNIVLNSPQTAAFSSVPTSQSTIPLQQRWSRIHCRLPEHLLKPSGHCHNCSTNR